jgi:hypothetical protein
LNGARYAPEKAIAFAHPNVSKAVTISGESGDDIQQYQERTVKKAIEESMK